MSRVQILDALSTSSMEKFIAQSDASWGTPALEDTTRVPSDLSLSSQHQDTLSGRIGGRPKISSTLSPTSRGLDVCFSTLHEEATIRGHESAVERKSCSFPADIRRRPDVVRSLVAVTAHSKEIRKYSALIGSSVCQCAGRKVTNERQFCRFSFSFFLQKNR